MDLISSIIIILSISLIISRLDISNLLSTKKKPCRETAGLFLWAVNPRGTRAEPDYAEGFGGRCEQSSFHWPHPKSPDASVGAGSLPGERDLNL